MALLFDSLVSFFLTLLTPFALHLYLFGGDPLSRLAGEQERPAQTLSPGLPPRSPADGSLWSLPVKKAIELKSRGVKMLPSKENSHKHSVCESTLSAGRCVRQGGGGVASVSGEVILQAPLPTFLPPGYFLEKDPTLTSHWWGRTWCRPAS